MIAAEVTLTAITSPNDGVGGAVVPLLVFVGTADVDGVGESVGEGVEVAPGLIVGVGALVGVAAGEGDGVAEIVTVNELLVPI